MFKDNLFLDESGAGGGAASAQASEPATTGEIPTFEAWVAGQDETVKGLLESHTKGLKSALDAERETRKGFEKQIKDLAIKAEKGSDAEKQLSAISEQMEFENRKASFYEDAHAQGVSNLKLAFLVASTENLFDKKGNVDFIQLKSKYPEVFAKPAPVLPKGNAGEGAQALPAQSMNDAIRKMAGR